MKSTKYQLLKDDFDHACEQLRINKKIIGELREENERYERMYENTGAIFNRQHMRGKIERYEKALADIRNVSTLDEYEGAKPKSLLKACYDIAREATS